MPHGIAAEQGYSVPVPMLWLGWNTVGFSDCKQKSSTKTIDRRPPPGGEDMVTWQDTAKRMRAHPEWKWLEGMLMATCLDGQVYPQQRFGEFSHEVQRQTLSYKPIPVLTDWPTVGVILGMVVEAGVLVQRITADSYGKRSDGGYGGCWRVEGLVPMGEQLTFGHNGEHLGQALGELWLELVGGG